MGIAETLAAFSNAWYTVTADGYAPYRMEGNRPMSPFQMAQHAQQTTQQYNVSVASNPYIPQEEPTIAYA